MRVNLGDVSRWMAANCSGDPVTVAFHCADSGTKCRLDLLSSHPARVFVDSEGLSVPAGPLVEGIMNLEFIGFGLCSVTIDAPAGAVVAVRRYDDHFVIEGGADAFTSYDPGNFIESDLDKMARIMKLNQARFEQQLEQKYAHAMRALRGKEEEHGPQGQEDGSSGEAPGGAPQAGGPASDAVTADD